MQVALDKEIRIRKVGQLLPGHLVEPIYAFDKLVIPVGTEVSGQITSIASISPGKRTLAALDADFTPTRAIEVTFNELILPDGIHLHIQTAVTPGSGQTIRFLIAADENGKREQRTPLPKK